MIAITVLSAALGAGMYFAIGSRLGTTAPEPSNFLRFSETGKKEGRLETATITYRRPGGVGDSDGVVVDLVGVVHVADGEYYRQFNREFREYDAVLYEMIKDADDDVTARRADSSILGKFQMMLKDVLALEFQLQAIDYSPSNFVHADMDPATFFRLMRSKNESVSTLMMRAMIAEWQRQSQGEGSSLHGVAILGALANPDSAYALKLLFAKEFHEIEALVAGIEKGPDGKAKGTVILSERNRVAIEVLEREMAKGHRRLAIFYGAAHMPDLEVRLRKLGFRKESERWLTAWDVRPGKTRPQAEKRGLSWLEAARRNQAAKEESSNERSNEGEKSGAEDSGTPAEPAESEEPVESDS